MPDLSLDSFLKIGEITAIVGSAAAALIAVGRSTSRVELRITRQSDDITDLKNDVKELNKLMTAVALQSQRMDMLNERINMMDRRYDELRHGQGWVTGSRGIDKEYP